MPIPFLKTPENRSAWSALQDLLHGLVAALPEAPANVLLIHGPTGSGKTFLVEMLARELMQNRINACHLSANDFAAESGDLNRHADVLIIEDLQHLPTRFGETLVQLIDERSRRQLPTVFTALCGPGQLGHRGVAFPRRLTTRLASGLVVGIQPLQTPGRRKLLTALAEESKLTIAPEIIDWLAEHLTGGGRQLTGAVRQIKTLQRLQKKLLRLDDLREHFRPQIEANAPTVQRIAQRVSDYFHVEMKRVLSEKRSHDVLLPRQVSMYLARQLTGLSLKQIGRSLGGRDHKTVQHACKKVAQAMKTDRTLSGAVLQLHAELA